MTILSLLIINVFIIFAIIEYKDSIIGKQSINIEALNDTILITNNKLNQVVYNKTLLTSDYKTLKVLNNDLVCELDKFNNKDKKHTAEISKLKFEIKNLNDSLDVSFIGKTDSSTYKYEFKDSTKYRTLAFQCLINSETKPTYIKSSITRDEIYCDLIIKKSDDNRLSVYSNNPYLIIQDIQGVTLKPLKIDNKRFSIGVGTQIGYGITNNGLSPYLGIGITLQYNLFKW